MTFLRTPSGYYKRKGRSKKHIRAKETKEKTCKRTVITRRILPPRVVVSSNTVTSACNTHSKC